MEPALIKKAAEGAGIALTPELAKQTSCFVERLLEANQQVNLTSITDPGEIATRHLQDSWMPSRFIEEGASVIDVGTGAGFPGIPLAIARPDIRMTLLDASLKRVRFLEDIIRQLFDDQDVTESGLSDVTAASPERPVAVHGRAEEVGRDPAFREQYDVAIARAVTTLPVLAEYGLPLVRVGGLLIAMKGRDDETKEGTPAIRRLGGEIEDVFRYQLDGFDAPFSLVIVRKKAATPERFPRKMAAIRHDMKSSPRRAGSIEG